ncbi:MAG: CAF17-like 4Fe-4S cluster assembly/insertion protein YgfZ [Planctomycetota bacterium]|jgi:folate-binding protein YgfZ
MLHDTPLRSRHEAYVRGDAVRPAQHESAAHRPGAATGQRIASAEVEYIPYGPPDEAGLASCEVVATFGSLESEYAAIRRGAGVLDSPHRGTLVVGGAERRDFFDRMVTAAAKNMAAGSVKPSFWLNRKGRIDADLLLIELEDRMVVDLGIHEAAPTCELLNGYIFSEGVEIEDASGAFHHVAIHGRHALEALAAAARLETLVLAPLAAATISIAGIEVLVARRDQTGEVGLELIMPYDGAEAVWEAVVGADGAAGEGRQRVRPIGWHAFNIARIEAGTPIYNIDFGPNNLPHETGVVDDRVSFTKGCYLGQEVVARIQNLGRPKQMLVGLKMARGLLPVAGGQVFEVEAAPDGAREMGDQVGVVTSSSLSPMLGAAPIAFAMLKTACAEPGSTVLVNAEGEQVEAAVRGLRFYDAAPGANEATEPA